MSADLISYERRQALKHMEEIPNEASRLTVFADYGLDDACATLYLLEHRDRYEHIDIWPIGGNVLPQTAIRNARKLLAAAKDDGISLQGVRIVDTSDQYQKWCLLPSVHGDDGMGDLLDPADRSPVPEIDYETWCATVERGWEIFSLGPCTMVNRALADAGTLPGGKILLMGGNVREKPNYEGREFNDGLDPNAFQCVIRRPHRAVTLDTCRVPAFNLAGCKKTGGRLLDTFVNRAVALAEARHPDNCYIYDYIAAHALVHPEWFEEDPVYLPQGVRYFYVLRLRDEFAARRDLL